MSDILGSAFHRIRVDLEIGESDFEDSTNPARSYVALVDALKGINTMLELHDRRHANWHDSVAKGSEELQTKMVQHAIEEHNNQLRAAGVDMELFE